MQSFRKRNAPKNTLTPGAQDSVRRASFNPQPPANSDTYNTLKTRSASFNPISDKDRMESFQVSMNAIFTVDSYFFPQNFLLIQYKSLLFLFFIHQHEQDQLFSLVSQVQCGRMDEQRCSINPLSPSPKNMDNSQAGQSVISCYYSTNALKSKPISEVSLLVHVFIHLLNRSRCRGFF